MPKFREIEGIKFYPLTLGDIQDHPEGMNALMGVTKGDNPFDPERFAKLTEIFTASANRTAARYALDDIKRAIDLSNMAQVTRAVLGQFEDPKDSDLKTGQDAAIPTSPQTGGTPTLGS